MIFLSAGLTLIQNMGWSVDGAVVALLNKHYIESGGKNVYPHSMWHLKSQILVY